ncbi:MAG: ABC transporter permease, partial [Oscillospiraceae bacterium]|nr:ABC transporter permease [Oscillospiraceae bacterium]
VGTLIGVAAAYFGGKIDNIIMRILDIWMAMPSLLVTLAFIAGMGVGIPQTIFALAFGATPGFARTLRAAALGVSSQEFIESSVAQGSSNWRIMVHDLIPNVISQILIQFTMNVSYMILLGSTLSFLGLGAQPPTPEWGAMLAEGLQNYQFHPYLVIYPGLFLAFTALAINIFGDALRDAFDPKLKGRA